MTAIIILLGLFPPIPVGFIPTPIVMQNLGIILAGILLGGSGGPPPWLFSCWWLP